MNDEKEFISGLDSKEHPLKRIYPLCVPIHAFLVKHGLTDFFADKKSLERISIGKSPEEALKAHIYKALASILAIIAVTVFLVCVLLLKRVSAISKESQIARPGTGEGTSKYALEVTDSESGNRYDVNVSVNEKMIDPDKTESYFQDLYLALEAEVLGENESLDCITGNLNLISQIPGTSAEVSWPEVDYGYILPEGKIRRESITEPVTTVLTARIEYFDEVRLYSFAIRLIPEPPDEKEAFMKKLLLMLDSENDVSKHSDYFTLPTMVDGKVIAWSEKKNNSGILLLVLGMIAASMVIPLMRAEVKKQEKEREKFMLRDYPDIVSKFVLLLNAGMTCRGAWEKICNDYNTGNHKRRYAYEEMMKSFRELTFGLSEATVYEHFGTRCGLGPYRKFGILLSNNLRRGSRDLAALLELESGEAFEERRELVKKQAEEAGTKLLLPMFGMLCLVFAIVMVPAFSSFGI